jgi:FkbM family methyltransferase
MSYLISYAQNFEDVILWRALHDVKAGNYIDIGAQSPDVDSVSRVFHEQGWHGLHIDAMRAYADELARARPGDRVLCAAVSSEPGDLAFFAIPSSGLSTSDRAIAERHMAEGFSVEEVRVEAITLDQVFLRAGFENVHWLKIDIEGYEAQAIEGWRESSLRPWIVVVESTVPLSQISSHAEWEPHLLAKGYRFVYFDGLNRFYVSDAHSELLDAFGPGPNVFDNFTLSGLASTPFSRGITAERDRALTALANARTSADADVAAVHEQISRAREELAGAHETSRQFEKRLVAALTDVVALEFRLQAADKVFEEVRILRAERVRLAAESMEHAEAAHRWWSRANQLDEELQLVRSSLSWRLTRPLRSIGTGRALKRMIKLVLRGPLIAVMRFAQGRPALSKMLARVARLHPGIALRLKQVATNNGLAPESNTVGQASATRIGRGGYLSTRAKRILDDLDRELGVKET